MSHHPAPPQVETTNQGTPSQAAPPSRPAACRPPDPRRTPSPRRWLLAAAVVLLLAGAGLLAAVWALCQRHGEILPGVSVAGVAVGGMPPQAARARLEERFSAVQRRRVLLVDGERQWQTTPGELGCGFDMERTLERAYAAGRAGSLAQRLRESWWARHEGLDLKPARAVNRTVLRQQLEALAARARIPARDARIRFDGRAFAITPERIGRRVDAEATEKNIVRYFDPLTHQRVTLVAADEAPRVTAAELRQIDTRLASYTTRFNPADVNRTQNVRLAARALDGTVIPAGAVFSYNEAVGPRVEALGYRVAKIFLRGQILDGVGGGVCQVASTVYNAALESGLPIVERARHSRPVPYVPEGRDATVSYGGVDLKFRNPFRSPLLIQTRVLGDTLTVSIYGNHRDRRGAARTARAAARGALRVAGELPKPSTWY